MKCIDEISAAEINGKRVLMRADFNVPLNAAGEVADVFRIKQGWQTVRYLSACGAKIILMSHIGRDPEASLSPVAHAIQSFTPITFVRDIVGPEAQAAVSKLQPGEIVLLENLRRDPRETENDPALARELAAMADMYVDDAFAVAHRAHASVSAIAKYLPSYSGFLLRNEIREINAARSPQAPSFAILGGAKFETKAPLIKLLLERYDHVFITGALANDVFKAKGLSVGRSLISAELPGPDVLAHPHFLAPIDVTVETSDKKSSIKKPEDVTADDKIVDIGPATVEMLKPYILNARFVLWNGPTGLYEDGYMQQTKAIAELIQQSMAQKVIGGGDTIALIEEAELDVSKLGFLSTGGGAMLEFLLKGSLPAIDALN